MDNIYLTDNWNILKKSDANNSYYMFNANKLLMLNMDINHSENDLEELHKDLDYLNSKYYKNWSWAIFKIYQPSKQFYCCILLTESIKLRDFATKEFKYNNMTNELQLKDSEFIGYYGNKKNIDFDCLEVFAIYKYLAESLKITSIITYNTINNALSDFPDYYNKLKAEFTGKSYFMLMSIIASILFISLFVMNITDSTTKQIIYFLSILAIFYISWILLYPIIYNFYTSYKSVLSRKTKKSKKNNSENYDNSNPIKANNNNNNNNDDKYTSYKPGNYHEGNGFYPHQTSSGLVIDSRILNFNQHDINQLAMLYRK